MLDTPGTGSVPVGNDVFRPVSVEVEKHDLVVPVFGGRPRRMPDAPLRLFIEDPVAVIDQQVLGC